MEVLNPHQVHMSQRGDTVEIVAVTRGTPLEGGGYMWHGEIRVWDNEISHGLVHRGHTGRQVDHYAV